MQLAAGGLIMATNIAAAAAVRLTLKHYFWTEIFYSMNVVEAKPEDGVDTLATDGRTMWINRQFFEKSSLDLQVSELVHEMGHKIFLHATRRGSREPELWNVAADHAINTMMKSNGFTIGEGWLCDMKYHGWLAEAIYADLMKERKEQEKNGGGGKPKNQQLAPGRQDIKEPQDMTPEQVSAHEDQVKALVDRAIANAKAMGNLPAGIEQGTVTAYKPVQESWYNQLHRYMQSLSTSTYNWARINRRALITHGLFAPLHYSEALGDVAIFLDTSGSCFQKAQQANFTEHLNAILAEAKPRRIHLYYFDTKVYPGEVIEAGELDIATKPKGGGGTSFVPIFQQLEDDAITPEVCIILTDMLGRFPDRDPDYPVVWADVLGAKEAPFGETIHVG
jgi:predicted metal-dependent peptidase